MKYTLIDEAFSQWSSGNPLEAGRLIYEQIPNAKRPVWAAAVLAECRRLIPSVSEIDAVYEIALTPSRWHEAHAAFSAVRGLTLEAERSKSTDPIYKGVLYIAENTAKVIFNASGKPAPFDHDSGWWLVSNLRHVVDKLNDSEFELKAWRTVINVA